MTTTEATFDNIPITVPGVYRYRCEITGNHPDGDGTITIFFSTRAGEMYVVDPGKYAMLPSIPFSRYASKPGAQWYFLKSLPES